MLGEREHTFAVDTVEGRPGRSTGSPTLRFAIKESRCRDLEV